MRVLAIVVSVAGALLTLRALTLDPLEWAWPAIWGLGGAGLALMLVGWLLAGLAAARAERRRLEAERRRRPGYIDRPRS
jgi:hypothetical protein